MIYALDFETYFDKQYSLRKLPLFEYLSDPRFRVLGAAVWHDGRGTWYAGNTVREVIPEGATIISHNALFDANVLRTLGVDPGSYRWFDTLAAARLVLPRGLDLSLDQLARLLLGSQKLGNLQEGVDDLAAYAIRDAELAYRLWDRLAPAIPEQELDLIHLTTLMGSQPRVRIDHDTLRQELERIRELRRTKLEAAGYRPEDEPLFRKRDWVFERLREVGVDLPSLNKKDPAVIRAKIENPAARALIEAREVCASVIEESRCKRLLAVPEELPMTLKYWGAHTGRWSGVHGLNWQNLSHASLIRSAITAPPGHAIVVADADQIELRFNLWFCGQHDLLHRLVNGEDLYSIMASELFGRPITKADKERQLGKITELACIAEGQRVLTDQGWVPIQHVTTDMRVWDGVEWVQHDGVVWHGTDYVIEYDGLIATDDHIVWTHRGVSTLGNAKQYNVHLRRVKCPPEPHHKGAPTSPVKVYDLLNCGPRHRFVCEGVLVHNCGYGQGWRTYQRTCASGPLGCDPVFLSDLEAQRNVAMYRALHPQVVGMWQRLDQLVRLLPTPGFREGVGPVTFDNSHGSPKIWLPNGTWLDYTGLHADDDGGMIYGVGKNRYRIYGGAVLENCIQALARIPIANAMLACEAAGYRVALTVHDEVVLVVPEAQAETAASFLVEQLSKPLDWAPGLTLSAKATYGERYAKP